MWFSLLSFLKSLGAWPYLGTILTVLKFLGLVVSSVAGFAAALPEPKNKRAAKLERRTWVGRKIRKMLSKEWTLRWVVIGLAVALLSQFLETIKANKEAEEARQKDLQAQIRTSNQVWTAQQSLNSIRSLLTHFDTISVTNVQFDMDCNFTSKGLLFASSLNNYFIESLERSNSVWQVDEPPNELSDSNALWRCDLPDLLRVFQTNNLTFTYLTKSNYDVVTSFLESLTNTSVSVYLNKERLTTNNVRHMLYDRQFDLEATLPESGAPRVSVKWVSSPHPQHIIFVWEQFNFPKKNWKTNGRISGISDLDKAYCYFRFFNTNDFFHELNDDMWRETFDLEFDNFSTTPTYLDRIDNNINRNLGFGRNIMEYQLPSTEDIMAGEYELSTIIQKKK
jgi:hypothetical protein